MLLLFLVVFFVLFPLMFILNGFVLSTLWGWFVTETFGIQQITIAQAIGIALIVGMLTYQAHDRDGDRNSGFRVTVGFVAPIFALIFGWIIHEFFM